MKIDYDPTIKRYRLDSRTTTRAKAISALRAEGLTCRKADLFLRLCKLAATVNRYLEALERQPAPKPDPEQITYEEFRRAFCNMLANALDRQVSLRKAARWIRENLRPGKKRISCYALKHTLDHWFQARGSACYLPERDFTDVLRRCGHVVKDGVVRIAELCD